MKNKYSRIKIRDYSHTPIILGGSAYFIDKDYTEIVCDLSKTVELYNRLLKDFNKVKRESKEYIFILDLFNKRELINRFNKEYNDFCINQESYKKQGICGVCPDAELIYKCYYQYKSYLDNILSNSQNMSKEEIVSKLKDLEDKENRYDFN